jgi:hypothetical protein
VVYAKRPFAGPVSVLVYLSRYTHRVAIANSRLIQLDLSGVTFKGKDYREKSQRQAKTMTLSTDKFIRRLLRYGLPRDLHRIRYYGFFANALRREYSAKAQRLLDPESSRTKTEPKDMVSSKGQPAGIFICPLCSAPMIIIDLFERGQQPRAKPIRSEAA